MNSLLLEATPTTYFLISRDQQQHNGRRSSLRSGSDTSARVEASEIVYGNKSSKNILLLFR
jgi:hypothetical protein